MNERTLTEHGSVHDVGIAEADLDGMHRVRDFLDQKWYHRVDKYDVSVLMQGHLESERAGFWPVLQHHLFPLDRKRRTCRTNQKGDITISRCDLCTTPTTFCAVFLCHRLLDETCNYDRQIVAIGKRRFILSLSPSAL